MVRDRVSGKYEKQSSWSRKLNNNVVTEYLRKVCKTVFVLVSQNSKWFQEYVDKEANIYPTAALGGKSNDTVRNQGTGTYACILGIFGPSTGACAWRVGISAR